MLRPTSNLLRDALTDLLWRSWTQIGLSGSMEKPDARVIDPEALLVMTLRFGANDPRLFDESLDWLAVNGRAISVQRLRNLTRRDEVGRTLAEAALDWAGSQEPTLAGWSRRPSQQPGVEIHPAPIRVRHPDPVLLRHGVRWPRIGRSGNSTTPRVKDPAAFAFLLRSFFGIGTRAEIVRIMLTDLKGPMTAARLARLTSFAKRNVQESLGALVEAGPLSFEAIGNEFHYSIHPVGWMEILDIPTGQPWPRFFDWIALLDVLMAFVPWMDSRSESEKSDYLVASEGRDVVETTQEALGALGIRLGARLDATGERFLLALDRIIDDLITIMGQPEAPSVGRLHT